LTTFALDTATRSPSFALVDAFGVVAERIEDADPMAGRRVLEAAHALFTEVGLELGDLTRIVVGIGPGGFTGVRIGIATALGLGQALGIEVVGATSLEALAHVVAADAPGRIVVPALDARRREVFTAIYRARADGGLDTLLAPCAFDPVALGARIAEQVSDLPALVVGEGAGLVTSGLADAVGRPLADDDVRHRVRAAALVARVDAGFGRAARPLYARLPDAEVNRLNALAAGT
jgi:tRNA threonylcarbamoyladenosine biosynthesis protein TsaB